MSTYTPLVGAPRAQVLLTTTGVWAVEVGKEWVPAFLSYPVIRKDGPLRPFNQEDTLRKPEFSAIEDEVLELTKTKSRYPCAPLLPASVYLTVPYTKWSSPPTPSEATLEVIDCLDFKSFHLTVSDIKSALEYNISEYYRNKLTAGVHQSSFLWFIHTLLLIAKRRFSEKTFRAIIEQTNAQLFEDQIIWSNLK